MFFRNKSFKYILFILSLLILSSCSVWENFTTYFNLYYNSKTLFNDAETNILSQQKDLFSNDPIIVQGNDKNTLVKVVEKCSNILQFDKNTSYVDEALMMLGKSFFYQGNIQKAKRKFEELIATNPDDPKELLEAKLWIVKCQFILRDNTEALQSIDQIRKTAIDEGYDELIKNSYIEEIKYYLREENYTQAVTLCNDFAKAYDDSKTRAEIYFELGRLYTLTGDNENAIIAYEKVLDNSPDFDLEIDATIKYADALRRAGQYEKSLSVFKDIRDKDKFSNSFSEIDFEIGKTLVGLGKYSEAYAQFKMVDSTYKNTPFAAASNYEIGNLYRTHLANFDSAAFYFSRAAALSLPKEYLDSAKSNNQLFGRYTKLRKDINKLNKQLYYSENPDIFSKDSAAYTQDSLKILNDYLAKKELQDIWKNVNITNTPTDSLKFLEVTIQRQSVIVEDSLNKVDSLIRIGLYNPLDTVGLKDRIQSSLVEKFIQDSLHTADSLANRNLSEKVDTSLLRKNIQKAFAVKSKELSDRKNNPNYLNQLLSNPNLTRLDTVKFKRNPPLKLKISIDSAKTVLAKNSLELGNLFLAELNSPDSAYAMYTTILRDYPSDSYYPNTLYALGSYYLTQNKKLKADSLFQIIYDKYKKRTIVNAAADKLNLPIIDLNYDPAKDQYASAEKLMSEGDYKQSLTKFYKIYNEYPKSAFAPKALYTSGWILENHLVMTDSAASIYDTLVSKYPSTVYGKSISQKLTLYKQEKARQIKAIQDSLANIEKHKTDSILVANNNVNEENTVANDEKIIEEKKPVKKLDEENINVTQVTNTNGHKKLEPLWDPRKHFQ